MSETHLNFLKPLWAGIAFSNQQTAESWKKVEGLSSGAVSSVAFFDAEVDAVEWAKARPVTVFPVVFKVDPVCFAKHSVELVRLGKSEQVTPENPRRRKLEFSDD